MEFREEEKHLSSPHLFTASSLEELFEQSTSSGKGWRGGCDGGIFLDPSFLLLALTHGLSRACSHLLVEYARFRVPFSPPQSRSLCYPRFSISTSLYWPALQYGYISALLFIFPRISLFFFFCPPPTILSYFPYTNPRNGLTDRRIGVVPVLTLLLARYNFRIVPLERILSSREK